MAAEWDIRRKEIEENIRGEETEREERIEKARKLEKGWELMRLCKQLIEENGEKWKKSKERRDIERTEEEERKARRDKAAGKKRETLEKIETKKIQQKITDCLMKLPQNRIRMVESVLNVMSEK